jgi:hypothetical protein
MGEGVRANNRPSEPSAAFVASLEAYSTGAPRRSGRLDLGDDSPAAMDKRPAPAQETNRVAAYSYVAVE